MSELAIDTLLKQHEFFAGLEPGDIAFLAENATRRPMDKNEILFKHGNRADRFYLVEEGEVSIEVVALTGPSLELQRLSSGEILGWSWLIPPYRWNFQARAEQAGAVIEFSGDAILKHCNADYRFGYVLFQRFSALMSRRLSEARMRMMEEWNPPGFA